MDLELYETKEDRKLRLLLENKAGKIMELQERVKKNPNDEGLKNELKFYIFDMQCTIEAYYKANSGSNFYGQFLKEAEKLTRKQKISGDVSQERRKFLEIKQAIRRGKASADKRHEKEPIVEMD